MSIVDVIYLKAQVPEDVRQLFNQLRNVKTIRGAHRTIKDDLLIVKWGDPLQESLKSILERRYAWYAEHGSLPIDSSFNLMGDKEFALTDAEPVAGLTAYSALTKKGMKAIVFDLPDEAVGVLQDVQRMVIAGETAEGYPLREVTLVVPSREEALDLHPIARQYDVQVAYVGDDDRLWNPFPPEYGSS